MNPMESMVERIQEITNCTKATANKVLDYYRKEKIVKIDVVNGSVLFIHGAFLDKDVLERCIERVSHL